MSNSTPGTVAHQAPLSVGFSRRDSWSGLPCPPPGDLPDLGIEALSPALQIASVSYVPPEKSKSLPIFKINLFLLEGKLLYNFVLVSAIQQHESAVGIHISEELMLWNCGVAEHSWEILRSKAIQPVHRKGNQSWRFIGRMDAEAETPILWLPDAKSWLTGRDSDAGKDWRWEEKGTREDEMAGWHHRLDRYEFE